MLALIYVLADLAKCDLDEPYKAATAIESAASRLGVKITDDTIAKYLRQAKESHQ